MKTEKIEQICLTCNKEFKARKDEIKKGYGRFCSHICYSLWRKTLIGKLNPLWKEKIKKYCKNCGNVYYTFPSIVNSKFCSRSCHSINNISIAKKKNTSIEIFIENIFKKYKINYKKQYPIKNIACVDFYLPKFNTIVECDGEYWHSIPKVKGKNFWQNAQFVLNGYPYIRLKEFDIKNYPSKVEYALKSFFTNL